jgi:hypothetical protein
VKHGLSDRLTAPEANRVAPGCRRLTSSNHISTPPRFGGKPRDQTSFDPDYITLPLEHFEPLVRGTFAAPRRI